MKVKTAPEPAAMETEPEAAEAEPSLSTQENSQDSLTDAAVGGLTQEESLGAEPVAAKPPRPSVRGRRRRPTPSTACRSPLLSTAIDDHSSEWRRRLVAAAGAS